MKKSIKVTPYKRGKRRYGAIYTLADGRKVYLAWRRTAEIFRSGKTTISEAMRDGTAAWALDEETLIFMRTHGIRAVGVLVRETGDIFLTGIEQFNDRTKAKVLNYEGRGGALQRYLPLQHFQHRVGRARI